MSDIWKLIPLLHLKESNYYIVTTLCRWRLATPLQGGTDENLHWCLLENGRQRTQFKHLPPLKPGLKRLLAGLLNPWSRTRVQRKGSVSVPRCLCYLIPFPCRWWNSFCDLPPWRHHDSKQVTASKYHARWQKALLHENSNLNISVYVEASTVLDSNI